MCTKNETEKEAHTHTHISEHTTQTRPTRADEAKKHRRIVLGGKKRDEYEKKKGQKKIQKELIESIERLTTTTVAL